MLAGKSSVTISSSGFGGVKDRLATTFDALTIFYRPQLLEALIGLFELPEDDDLPSGEHFIEVDDTGW